MNRRRRLWTLKLSFTCLCFIIVELRRLGVAFQMATLTRHVNCFVVARNSDCAVGHEVAVVHCAGLQLLESDDAVNTESEHVVDVTLMSQEQVATKSILHHVEMLALRAEQCS